MILIVFNISILNTGVLLAYLIIIFMNEENNHTANPNGGSGTLSLPLRKLHDIGGAILIAFAFLIPIFFIPSSFFNFSAGKMVFVIVTVLAAFVLAAFLSIRRGLVELPKHPLFIAALSIPLVYLLSSVLSVSGFIPSVAGYGSETYTFTAVTFFILLFFLTVFFFKKNSNIFYLYLSLAASAFVLALFFLVRFFTSANFLSLGFFNSLNASPMESWSGIGILFGLVFILGLFTYEMFNLRKLFRWLLGIVMLVSLFFLILVNITWLWVSIGLAILFFIVYKMTGNQESEEVGLPLFSMVALFITLTLIFFGGPISGIASDKIGVRSDDLRPSFNATMQVAGSTITENPLRAIIGAGPMDFSYQWMQYKPEEILGTRFWNVEFGQGHSFFGSVPVTTGLAGVISWLAFIVLFLYLIGKGFMLQSFDNDNFTRYVFISSAAVSVILLIAMSMTLLPVALLSLFFIFAAIPVGVMIRERELKTVTVEIKRGDRKGSLYVVAVIFITGSLALFSAFVVMRDLSGYFFEKAAFAYVVENDLPVAESNFDWAVSLSEQDRYYRVAAEFPIARIRNYIELLRNGEISQENFSAGAWNEFQLARRRAERAVSIRSAGYRNWLTLGRIHQEMLPFNTPVDSYTEAINAYTEAIRHNPKNPAIILQMARLELVNGNLEDARRYNDEALEIKPNYANAMFFKSQLDIREGKLEEARESIVQAINIEPFDAGLYFQLGVLHYEDQQINDAIVAFNRAVQLAPRFDNARYFLSLSLYQTDQSDYAIEILEDLADRYQNTPQLVSILNNMRSGVEDPLDGVADFDEPTPELPIEEDIPGIEDGIEDMEGVLPDEFSEDAEDELDFEDTLESEDVE